VKALIAYGEKMGNSMQLLQSVIDINAVQPYRMIELLKKHYPALEGLKVAVLGMAFKPGTDDIRESPSLPVTRQLLDEKAIVSAYDPIARHEAEKVFPEGIAFTDELEAAIADADAILLMTRWQHFEKLPELVAGRDPQPLVVDGRRMLDKTAFARYEGIGL